MARYTQDEWARAHPNLKPVGDELKGPCPACGGDDRFRVSATGHVFCRKCCPDGSDLGAVRHIEDAAGLNGTTRRREWTYKTVAGETVKAVRIDGPPEGKRFHRDPRGVKGPYLPLMMPGDGDGPVVLVEGETCAEAVHAAGLSAVCWIGGASAVGQTAWHLLAVGEGEGDSVVLWPDHDKAGRQAMREIAAILKDRFTLRAVRVPEGRPKGWDAADADPETIRRLVDEAGDDAIADLVDSVGAAGDAKTGTGSARQKKIGAVLERHGIDPERAKIATRVAAKNHAGIVGELARMLDGEYVWLTMAGWHCRHGSMWTRDREAFGVGRLGRELLECYGVIRTSVASSILLAITGLKGALGETGDGWDDDPHLVGTPSGRVIDLRTGRTVEGVHRITKAVGADPGNARKAKSWEAHLKSSLPTDVQMWLRRWLGYCITGLSREDKYLYACGTGRNGKGILINTLRRACGDYGKTLRADAMLTAGRGQHTQNIARLEKARVVVVPDMPRGKWNTARLKAFTGGDSMEANLMRENSREFIPRFKLLFAGNYKPSFPDRMQHADKARLALLEFPHTFEDDASYEDRLLTELPHIVAWLIDAAADYLAHGLPALPKRMAAAVEDYASDQDTVRHFAEEHLDFERKEAHVLATAVAMRWFQFKGARRVNPRLPRDIRDALLDTDLRDALGIQHEISYGQFNTGAYRGKAGFTGVSLSEGRDGD